MPPTSLPDGGPAATGRPARSLDPRTAALPGNATTEWLSARPAPDRDDPACALTTSCASRRQITARVLYHDSIRDDPDATACARQIGACGARVRTTTAQIPAIVISDRQLALILKNPADPAAGTACTKQPAIISALATLFELAWNTAEPLTSSRPRTTAERAAFDLAPAERDLLKLLADGATDEAAVRYLGMSLRTVRRHIAGLMTRLDAISRFQAGAEAARCGWLA